ncbi:uncharacterized protein [Ptychodera flava]|uniref:uncharacterized protein isoform X2 n=1 Tax=Ptychodera flava TaxID=63121 RepID=UPI00396A61C9
METGQLQKSTCGKYPQNCDLCDKSINSKIELEVHYQCWHNILPRSQKDGPHRFSTSSNTPKVQSTLVPSETLGKTKPYARQSDSINTTLKQIQTQTDSDSSKASTAKRLTAEPPTSIENKSIENAIIKPGLDANLDIVGALHGVAAALQPITDLTCGKTETNPETTRIIGVLKNVASALNPLLKDNLTVKIKDKKTAEDRTIQDAIEQLHHLYVMLEKGLKEMIKNGRNSGKGESCYACTSLTVVINGTMEIIAKPKQTDIVHKMRLPVQQKVQRCIDTSQPIPQHPQKVSTILKYSEKTGLTELSSQKVAGVASPFHLPPGMMMVKCQDPVPGMLQHGIPLVRLPGFVQSLPRPASVPSKSHHGSVAVAASQMTSGTKPSSLLPVLYKTK